MVWNVCHLPAYGQFSDLEKAVYKSMYNAYQNFLFHYSDDQVSHSSHTTMIGTAGRDEVTGGFMTLAARMFADNVETAGNIWKFQVYFHKTPPSIYLDDAYHQWFMNAASVSYEEVASALGLNETRILLAEYVLRISTASLSLEESCKEYALVIDQVAHSLGLTPVQWLNPDRPQFSLNTCWTHYEIDGKPTFTDVLPAFGFQSFTMEDSLTVRHALITARNMYKSLLRNAYQPATRIQPWLQYQYSHSTGAHDGKFFLNHEQLPCKNDSATGNIHTVAVNLQSSLMSKLIVGFTSTADRCIAMEGKSSKQWRASNAPAYSVRDDTHWEIDIASDSFLYRDIEKDLIRYIPRVHRPVFMVCFETMSGKKYEYYFLYSGLLDRFIRNEMMVVMSCFRILECLSETAVRVSLEEQFNAKCFNSEIFYRVKDICTPQDDDQVLVPQAVACRPFFKKIENGIVEHPTRGNILGPSETLYGRYTDVYFDFDHRSNPMTREQFQEQQDAWDAYIFAMNTSHNSEDEAGEVDSDTMIDNENMEADMFIDELNAARLPA